MPRTTGPVPDVATIERTELEDADAQVTQTGLETPYETCGKGKARAAAKKLPQRKGEVWDTVKVLLTDKAYTTAPELECRDCGKSFSGGVTRVKHHIVTHCTCSTDALKALKNKLVQEKSEKESDISAKRTRDEVDKRAETDEVHEIFRRPVSPSDEEMAERSKPVARVPAPPQQRNLPSMVSGVAKEIMDDKIADFIYGEGLPFSIAESPQFTQMLQAAKSAPTSYKPPSRERLAGMCCIWPVCTSKNRTASQLIICSRHLQVIFWNRR